MIHNVFVRKVKGENITQRKQRHLRFGNAFFHLIMYDTRRKQLVLNYKKLHKQTGKGETIYQQKLEGGIDGMN